MNEPVRQHTVAACYLRGFSVDEKALYELRDGGDWFKNSIKSASVCKHMYTFQNSSGARDYAVEKALAKLEGEAGPILKKIDTQGVDCLPNDEKQIVANFIAVQHFRTKKMRHIVDDAFERLQEPENKARFTEENRDHFRKDCSDAEIDEYIERILQGKEVSEDPDFFVTSIMFSISERTRNLILMMRWRTETIKRGDETLLFVTSDTPFAVRNRGKLTEDRIVGLNAPNAEFYFPISRRTMLIGSHESVRSQKNVKQFRVDELNKITMVNRFESIFAQEPSEHVSAILKSLNGFRIPNSVPPA